jgi:hypothetical protein
VVDRLIAAGADVRARDKLGRGAIFFVSSRPSAARLLGILKTLGCDVGERDHLGRTALHYAVMYASADSIVFELLHKITIEALTQADNFGWTALQFAIDSRQPDFAQQLLRMAKVRVGDSKDDLAKIVNHKTMTGKTALHLAAANGDVNTCTWLMWFGADPTLTDNRGWTAADYATLGNTTIVRNLLAVGWDSATATRPVDAPRDDIAKSLKRHINIRRGYVMGWGITETSTEEEEVIPRQFPSATLDEIAKRSKMLPNDFVNYLLDEIEETGFFELAETEVIAIHATRCTRITVKKGKRSVTTNLTEGTCGEPEFDWSWGRVRRLLAMYQIN